MKKNYSASKTCRKITVSVNLVERKNIENTINAASTPDFHV
jgi:hypothetical protein